MKEEQKSNRIGLEQDKAKTPNRAEQTAEMEIKMNDKSLVQQPEPKKMGGDQMHKHTTRE
jgi:hypothetical protein